MKPGWKSASTRTSCSPCDLQKPLSGFDTAFGRAQVEGYRAVIAAYETYLLVGTADAVKKFVSKPLPKMKENADVAARLPGGDASR